MQPLTLDSLRSLAFIGGGNMAAALVGGIIKAGLACERIIVADPNPEQLRQLETQYAVRTTTDNGAAVTAADVIVLAVKPQMLESVTRGFAAVFPRASALVISVAAGIPIDALAGWLGRDAAIVRTMPNRPALNGVGASALYAPPAVQVQQRALAQSIMQAVGIAVWVDEERQLDTVTALSGSGPAYFFALMEALETAAVRHGLPADIARQLTLATAFGAAVMARESSDSLATLRGQVTSKGGTTAAALAVLEGGGFSGLIGGALAAAERRSAELAAEFAPPPSVAPDAT